MNNMYFYKLTLRNGMVYYIKDKESNITAFMQRIAKANHWTDFVLAEEEVNVNTVALFTSEIIAVGYMTDFK
jgi:hypothetical protein